MIFSLGKKSFTRGPLSTRFCKEFQILPNFATQRDKRSNECFPVQGVHGNVHELRQRLGDLRLGRHCEVGRHAAHQRLRLHPSPHAQQRLQLGNCPFISQTVQFIFKSCKLNERVLASTGHTNLLHICDLIPMSCDLSPQWH